MRANSRMSERCLPTSHVLCAGDGKERRWKGASQICRDQDGKSLIRISGRDSRGTYLRFHKSARTSARAWMHMSCATETPEYACKPCHSAVIQCARIPKQVCMQSHATHHLFLLLSIIYIYISPFSPRPHAHPHALIFRRCAQYLPVDHAVATKVPAPCSSRACVVRFAQVDMLHVMRGDGVTDRANG